MLLVLVAHLFGVLRLGVAGKLQFLEQLHVTTNVSQPDPVTVFGLAKPTAGNLHGLLVVACRHGQSYLQLEDAVYGRIDQPASRGLGRSLLQQLRGALRLAQLDQQGSVAHQDFQMTTRVGQAQGQPLLEGLFSLLMAAEKGQCRRAVGQAPAAPAGWRRVGHHRA